jgi:hypothetical protein
MSKATYPLKLPLPIEKAAQRLAKEDGVSLNQWIAWRSPKKSASWKLRPTFQETSRQGIRRGTPEVSAPRTQDRTETEGRLATFFARFIVSGRQN